MTSCSPEPRHAGATPRAVARPLAMENRLHYIRDVTFDEDRATVRAGHAPQVMAAFRNTALGLLRRLGRHQHRGGVSPLRRPPRLALAAVGLTDFA